MSLRARTIWILVICALMVYMAIPNLFSEAVRRASPWIPDSGVALGLDLQGGIHWLLAVDADEVRQKRLASIGAELNNRVQEGDQFGTVREIDGRELEVCGADAERLRELRRDNRLELAGESEQCSRFTLTSAELTRQLRRGADQAMEVIRRRVSSVKEPIIVRQGDDRILVQLPGGDLDPVRARTMITGTTFLEFKEVLAAAENEDLLRSRYPDGLPPDAQIVASAEGSEVLLVPREPILTGSSLEDARLDFDQMNQPVVAFTWNGEGARVFRAFTRDHTGDRLAAIIDGRAITSPVINNEIGRNGLIQGGFRQAEATDLALRLRSGSLPIALRIEEERTVGPGLGADSINRGVYSTLFGSAGVLLLTALYYGIAGVFASVALVLNVLIVLGFMGAFEATLTLPGIAGLALTVGMAVDSNIIVFERIREEQRAGRPVRNAVLIGFKRSVLTIIDANVTTLIAAMVLYYIGRGPIQGFGVTLAVGIGATVFCALTVTRLMMEQALEHRIQMKV
jgi:protein-export membrane protein SecD